MKKFRSFLTILFLLAAVVIILLIAIFDITLFSKAADLIRDNIWPAVIALVIFLIFLSAGIVSNAHNIEGSLLSNGYFQVAVLELFLFAGGLLYFWYYNQQPGQIVLRLQPEDTKEYINLGISHQSDKVDTVTAPGELLNRPAGIYRIETLDQDIVYFQTEIELDPYETETVIIPVNPSAVKLQVQTEPADAELWIDGIHAANSPHTFEIAGRDTVILEIKLAGYQTYVDTISLREPADLGIIALNKLYALRISCPYPESDYLIYDADGKMILSAMGSRTVHLPKGRYKIAYGIGEGQYETINVSLSYNQTVSLP